MSENQSQSGGDSSEFKLAPSIPVILGLSLVVALFMPWISIFGMSISGFGLMKEGFGLMKEIETHMTLIILIPAGIGVLTIITARTGRKPLIYGIPAAGTLLILVYQLYSLGEKTGADLSDIKKIVELSSEILGIGVFITLFSLIALAIISFISPASGSQRQSGSGTASTQEQNSFDFSKRTETPAPHQETDETPQATRQNLQDQGLEHVQKKKTRQYLTTAAVVAVGVIAALFVLLYGRVNISPPVPAPAPTPAPAPVPEITPDNQAQEILDAEFREKINFYENEVKPEIALLNLPGWASEEQLALENKERSAIEDFSTGKPAPAIKKIDELVAEVSELKKAHEENFLSAFEEAKKAFESHHFEPALAAINRVLLYKPDDAESLKLKGRIAVMEGIATLVKDADVARAESKPDKEISFLTRAVNLDPERNDLVERRRLLVKQKRERDFDAFLEKGWTAFNRKDINRAKENLNQAAQIFSNRREISLLSGEIKQYERKLSYQNFIAKAQADASSDDWTNAEAYYTKALELFPDDKKSRTGFDQAYFINRQTQKIEKALSRPHRLSDPNIADITKNLIEESKEAADDSPKLQRLMMQLSDVIQQMSISVPVAVHSDNKTHVSVLGVGNIGKVREYHLQEGLKPGRYTFKGTRKGFKDKLVHIQIRPGEAASVVVICDESI